MYGRDLIVGIIQAVYVHKVVSRKWRLMRSSASNGNTVV